MVNWLNRCEKAEGIQKKNKYDPWPDALQNPRKTKELEAKNSYESGYGGSSKYPSCTLEKDGKSTMENVNQKGSKKAQQREDKSIIWQTKRWFLPPNMRWKDSFLEKLTGPRRKIWCLHWYNFSSINRTSQAEGRACADTSSWRSVASQRSGRKLSMFNKWCVSVGEGWKYHTGEKFKVYPLKALYVRDTALPIVYKKGVSVTEWHGQI